ncbi:hypothetical protein LUZ60_016316 [Juncus effusus]|nr:hypothetical protein LUZ60_016316 [Juncus effusus]
MASTLTHSPFLSRLPLSKPFRSPKPTKTRLTRTTSPFASVSSSSSWEREEARWLREEQRWLREEQRWLREEERWREERDKLLNEIAGLRMRIGMTDKKERMGGGFGIEVVRRPALAEKADVKEMVFEEVVRVEEVKEVREVEEKKEKEKEKKESERRVLRMGAEGKDVKALQEALQKLGFYSGEEDMEFSSFSTGTYRAVKTWQASVGSKEDGIMTSELLELLFSENEVTDLASNLSPGSVNGATVASITQIEETIIKENDNDSKVDVTKNRVFLLGENRWEDSSRLIKTNNNKSSTMKNVTKCVTCRGEGRLMCTECDGTGEPNIEPQFMEWVDEGMKCPYCDGLGYTVCDVCEGKTPVQK